MSVRALDGGGMARSVRTMAHPCKSATETIIDMLVDDVFARFPRILARLGDGGTGCIGRGSGKFRAKAGPSRWLPDLRLARAGWREGFLIKGFGGPR